MGQDQKDAPSAFSRVTAAISGALVLGLFGYLTLLAVRPERPAEVTARVARDETRRVGEDLQVPIEIENAGDAGVMAVVVEVTTRGVAGPPADTTIDYLAGHETRRVVVSIPAGGGEIEARVTSFQEP